MFEIKNILCYNLLIRVSSCAVSLYSAKCLLFPALGEDFETGALCSPVLRG